MAFKYHSGFLLCLPLQLFVWAAGGRADAQEKLPALPPHFSDHVAAKFHQQSLKQIVAELDKQAGLNILIDGEPLAPLADLAFDGTLEEVLNKIADTFDYNWKAGKGGIVLFNKRFRNRNDAPQASLSELTHLIKNMNDIFGLVNVDPQPFLWSSHLIQLGKSLTVQQRSFLLTEKRLRARELKPEQFLNLRTAVMNNTFGNPMKVWADLSDHLRTLDTAYLVATRAQDDPAHLNVPQYSYEIFWHDRDGSLSSENISIRFFGDL